jgi:hypothetical protein
LTCIFFQRPSVDSASDHFVAADLTSYYPYKKLSINGSGVSLQDSKHLKQCGTRSWDQSGDIEWGLLQGRERGPFFVFSSTPVGSKSEF